jgi:hypothetical protein
LQTFFEEFLVIALIHRAGNLNGLGVTAICAEKPAGRGVKDHIRAAVSAHEATDIFSIYFG